VEPGESFEATRRPTKWLPAGGLGGLFRSPVLLCFPVLRSLALCSGLSGWLRLIGEGERGGTQHKAQREQYGKKLLHMVSKSLQFSMNLALTEN
jgi:hypothetical protein